MFRGVVAAWLAAAVGWVQANPVEPDRALAKSVVAVTQSRLPDALDTLEKLTSEQPNFRLAYLIKGDVLLARTRPISTLGNAQGSRRGDLDQLREEARQRVRALAEAIPNDRVPAYLINLADDIRHVLVVDASRSRLYVFENRNGIPMRVADFYMSVGKAGMGKQREGDNRTPIGVYTITSFKSPRELDDFYGSGAWVLSYPNDWDLRQGRTGHGIWIHGTPSNTYSRVPRASEGCVVLANDDLIRLGRYIEAGRTPVVIAESVEWISYDMLDERRRELLAALDSWRLDWESGDPDRLLAHYSPDFRAGRQDFRAFAEHKRRVAARKDWIKVGLDRVNVLLYPERPDFALVTFTQHYQSSNFSDRTQKRQFWSRENGRWIKIHETTL